MKCITLAIFKHAVQWQQMHSHVLCYHHYHGALV